MTVLVDIQFEGLRKEVTISSALSLVNNTKFDIIIAGARKDATNLKEIKIEPNECFDVPLTWFLKRKYLMIKSDSVFEKLFENDILETFDPSSPIIESQIV